MKELTFQHEFNQELYDRAMMKYDKMIETESGQKFFTHLVKAFIHSGTEKKVEESEHPNGLLQCDLTKTKLIAVKSFEQFSATCKAKIASFVRNEGETDEQFELRHDMYLSALNSSNPYAVSASFGWIADKTDKVLCQEAMAALCDKYNSIIETYDKDSDLYKMLKPVERRPKKFKKVKPEVQKEKKQKPKPSYRPKGTTIGDIFDLKKMGDWDQ